MKQKSLILTLIVAGALSTACENGEISGENAGFSLRGDSALIVTLDDGRSKGSDTYSIEYFDGGWFPAPGEANWRTKLILDRVKGQSEIFASYHTPSCTVEARIPKARFLKLDRLVRSSADELKGLEGQNPDAGTIAVTVNTTSCESIEADLSGHSGGEDAQAIKMVLDKVIIDLSKRCSLRSEEIPPSIGDLPLRSDEIPSPGIAPSRPGELAVREEFDLAVEAGTKAALELFIERHPKHFLTKCAREKIE